jgi:hypothetical protein
MSSTMPIETESMNAVFMTDHGSSRVTSSRARRGPSVRGAAAGADAGAAATGGTERGSGEVDGIDPAGAGRAPAAGTETLPARVEADAWAGVVTGIGAVEPARPVPARAAVPSLSTEPAP